MSHPPVASEAVNVELPELSAINEQAKVYATMYASPHHMLFSVEGLRSLFAALASRHPDAAPGAGAGDGVVAWMHEFTEPFSGERVRVPHRVRPRDYDLTPGDTVRPLVYGDKSPSPEELRQWAEAMEKAGTKLANSEHWKSPVTAEISAALRSIRKYVPAKEHAESAQREALTDTQRLDWLDATNKRFRMGWKVGMAPAGNVSIQSVIQVGTGPLTSIREAIDHAMEAGNA